MISLNKWTEISFNLHESVGYLDRLYSIYPMLDNERRMLNPIIKLELHKAFQVRDNKRLFKLLLNLQKFPIKDSYKPYFTRVPLNELDNIIDTQPATISRICDRIYSLGFDNMIESIEEPIETNRQIGPMFPNWIRKQYKSYIDFISFLEASDSISVLQGSDNHLVTFVKQYLNVDLPTGAGDIEKGLDMVVKVNTPPVATFVIGEAKFLTDEGGHQNAQLKDALHLITSNSFKNRGKYTVIRIAILDGVCWIKSKNTKMQKDIRGLNDSEIAISALLLDDFFKTL